MKRGFCVVIYLLIILLVPVNVQAIESKWNENVSINKIWTIKLNKSVDKNSVNNSTIYMLDSQGNKEDIVIDLLMIINGLLYRQRAVTRLMKHISYMFQIKLRILMAKSWNNNPL